jgi:hypothetical protein
MNIIPNIPQGVNIIYVFLLILLGIYVYFIQRNSGFVRAVLSESLSIRPFVKIKNYSTSKFVVSLLIICNLSFFLYKILQYKIIPTLPQIDLLWCFLIVALYFSFERFFLLWMSSLFEKRLFAKVTLRYYQVTELFFLLFSVPVMLLIPYFSDYVAEFILEGLLVFCCVLWVVCIFRSIMATKYLTKFSILHIFLYLCTLKILPILVLGKIIILYAAN